MANKDLSKLLRLIADIVESDQAELTSFVYNKVRSARAEYGKVKKGVDETAAKMTLISDQEIVRLEAFENREELSDHLKRTYQRKSDVDAVVKALRISVSKNANYDDIVDKIIDALIGYKIRSRAIRGE
jgi:hypothetical protein